MHQNYYQTVKSSKQFLITECTPYSSIDLFATLAQRKYHTITEKQITFLNFQMTTYKKLSPELFDYALILYLSCNPNVNNDRIRNRARPEECGHITTNYLHDLNDQYQEWFSKQKHAYPDKYVQIDADRPITTVLKEIIALLHYKFPQTFSITK